jgi:acetyl esterase/lipase
VGTTPIIDEGSCVPEQLVDLMAAMRVVHEHAQEWDIDERRVYVMGFSAGAHLVGSLAERFDEAELLARAGATVEQASRLPSGSTLTE